MSSPAAAEAFIAEAVQLRDRGSSESALVQHLDSHLRLMFPESPAWVSYHVRHAEAMVRYSEGEASKRAFIDNLVGYTSIEYERDLRQRPLHAKGLSQVREHLAGLLNEGTAADKVLGILSDTVEWSAWRVAAVRKPAGAQLSPADLDLEKVDDLDLGRKRPGDGERLIEFLERHLGREAGQRLAAETVRADLGLESHFAETRMPELTALVDRAFAERPEYGEVIEGLWTDFVGYVGEGAAGEFRRDVYMTELYVTTLAKLLCANVIVSGALHSDDRELEGILDGRFFRSRGLENLVEHDYFGWLNSPPYVAELVGIARDMQRGLRSYDFEAPASEDLFGELMAQLARHSQRLLLGQEWTPPWLAEKVAGDALDRLPEGTPPRFVDVCCGSGAFLVAVIKRLIASHPEAPGEDDLLTQAVTGFDVDPLAVMLAKINWVIAARERLGLVEGRTPVSIPVYHADSMFAKTPIGTAVDAEDRKAYAMLLHDRSVTMPAFLVEPANRELFDSLMKRAQSVAAALAREPRRLAPDPSLVEAAIAEAPGADRLSADELATLRTMLGELIEALEHLEREDLNGIWGFVIRNSYRPRLLAGQFNGLLTNPPWLAMSKLADNPYRADLEIRAKRLGISPPGAAFLHTELATTFLLHAVRSYLQDGAVVGCILPDTVLNGAQHEPFRQAAYAAAPTPVELNVTELWRVEKWTFKNEAIMLLGSREAVARPESRPGRIVGPAGSTPTTFNTLELRGGARTAWTEGSGVKGAGGARNLGFRQGFDCFPRTTVFHKVSPQPGGKARLSPIGKGDAEHYLVSDSKRLKEFRISPATVPDRFLFDVLLSKHLVPFHLLDPAAGLLPIERGPGGEWEPVPGPRLAATPEAEAVFDEIAAALGAEAGLGAAMPLDEYFRTQLDERRKLSSQRLQDASGHLLVYGAGGGVVAAATVPLESLDRERLTIDQTLYWSIAADLDEALYYCGLLNSDALLELIGEFQPRGAFGKRHVHTLPTAVTPRFEPDRDTHRAVVAATRALLEEYRAAIRADEVARCLDPNRALASRRRTLRRTVLPSLPAFADYAAACRALYGVQSSEAQLSASLG
jgi:SAM-dependent methyltransferase